MPASHPFMTSCDQDICDPSMPSRPQTMWNCLEKLLKFPKEGKLLYRPCIHWNLGRGSLPLRYIFHSFCSNVRLFYQTINSTAFIKRLPGFLKLRIFYCFPKKQVQALLYGASLARELEPLADYHCKGIGRRVQQWFHVYFLRWCIHEYLRVCRSFRLKLYITYLSKHCSEIMP